MDAQGIWTKFPASMWIAGLGRYSASKQALTLMSDTLWRHSGLSYVFFKQISFFCKLLNIFLKTTWCRYFSWPLILVPSIISLTFLCHCNLFTTWSPCIHDLIKIIVASSTTAIFPVCYLSFFFASGCYGNTRSLSLCFLSENLIRLSMTKNLSF